jgi:hypothetical protein
MCYPKLKQQGVILILMAFIIGLGTAAYIVKTMNVVTTQNIQEKKTFNALNRAKSALISWAVSHEFSPGQMPWPDRNGDGNYDGSSDCVATAFQYSYLIGQLPSLPMTSPCFNPKTGSFMYTGLSTYPGLGERFEDAQGNTLWYAVSRNLVRNYQTATNPIINPSLANTPTYQWLKVLDRNGNLISNRVAVVIMAPGSAIGNQNRSGNAPNVSQYLDSFQVGAATFSNRGYVTEDEDFVMGEDLRNVSSNDPSLSQPYYFNDKLVYITVDELMAALQKRVGEQARASLKTYQDANGNYPYAAQLGTSSNFGPEQNLSAGFLPVDYQSCNYALTGTTSSSLACTQPIFDANNPSDGDTSGISQVSFLSGVLTFVSNTGACTRNPTNTRCTCTSNGSCSALANLLTFTCTNSSCTAAGTGANGTYNVTGGKFTNTTGTCIQTAGRPSKTSSCTNSDSLITCAGAATGAFSSSTDARFDNILPSWFESNNWQSYVYYQMTRPSSATIMLGTKTTEATIITTGSPIIASPFAIKGSAQVTPSCDAINNYLDSVENANGDLVFEASHKQKSTNYNDQTFGVTP